ncbi:MAG: hypothetical protein K1X55_08795 [Chitinophagales bacterium]|nr:hypothetical protein [Chitinophagales bacterium]
MQGQPICQKERVYFDYGSSQLSLSEQQDLSAFVASLNGVVLVELYGYTDTFNTVSFNQTLAKQRLETVKRWMSQNYHDSLVFKEFIIGEDGSGSKADSIKRRVEINSIPITNGYLKLSDDNASVEIPIDYYKECQICKNPPVFKFIDTEEEISRENIDLVSTNGEELVTCGMAKVEFNSCNGKKPPLCKVKICNVNMVEQAGLWTPMKVAERIIWQETDQLFSKVDSNGCIETTSSYDFVNSDKKKVKIYAHYLVIDKLEKNFQLLYENKKQVLATEDQEIRFRMTAPNSMVKLLWYSSDSGLYYYDYLNKLPFDTILMQSKEDINRVYYYHDISYHLKESNLHHLYFSDTITKLRLPKNVTVDTIGYTIPPFKVLIPLEEISNHQYKGKKPLFGVTPIGYLTQGKERQIPIRYIKQKYQHRKKTLNIRIRRKAFY